MTVNEEVALMVIFYGIVVVVFGIWFIVRLIKRTLTGSDVIAFLAIVCYSIGVIGVLTGLEGMGFLSLVIWVVGMIVVRRIYD